MDKKDKNPNADRVLKNIDLATFEALNLHKTMNAKPSATKKTGVSTTDEFSALEPALANDDDMLFMQLLFENKLVQAESPPFMMRLAEENKPKCLNVLLDLAKNVDNRFTPFLGLASKDGYSAAIVRVLVRHSVKHKIDVNFIVPEVIMTGKTPLLLASALGRYDVVQELMLADGIEMNAACKALGLNAIDYAIESLPCFLVLLEDGRVNISKTSGAINRLLSRAFTAGTEPSQHVLHELIKAGCSPSKPNQAGETPMDVCENFKKGGVECVVGARELLVSYMKNKPIEQRVVEKLVTDSKGRCIRHRFYADDTEKMGLHLLPYAFDKYMDSLKVKDLDILPNGKSRMTFTFTKDIGDGKMSPRGMFTSRVINSKATTEEDEGPFLGYLRDLVFGGSDSEWD